MKFMARKAERIAADQAAAAAAQAADAEAWTAPTAAPGIVRQGRLQVSYDMSSTVSRAAAAPQVSAGRRVFGGINPGVSTYLGERADAAAGRRRASELDAMAVDDDEAIAKLAKHFKSRGQSGRSPKPSPSERASAAANRFRSPGRGAPQSGSKRSRHGQASTPASGSKQHKRPRSG